MRIGIFAIRDIPEGTELTFDYQFENYGFEFFQFTIRNEPQPCYCMEENCTGFIGKKAEYDENDDDPTGEDLSEEESDEESADKQKTQAQGKALQSFEQVKGIVKYLMMYSSNASKVLRAVNKLLRTDSISLLRKFIHFRGLYLLERCLAQHSSSKSIVKHNILLALQMLPISTKNAIVKLECMVQPLVHAESYGFATAELAKKLLDGWSTLEMVYKIPKRTKSEMDSEDGSCSVEIKRIRSIDSNIAGFEHRMVPPLPPKDNNSIYSSFSSFHSGIVKEIEHHRPELAWNQILIPNYEKKETESIRSNEVLTPATDLSVEQMVEMAQEATRRRLDAERKKQMEELEEQKRLYALKKKSILARKEKQRELSQSLGKKFFEKAEKSTSQSPTKESPKPLKSLEKHSKRSSYHHAKSSSSEPFHHSDEEVSLLKSIVMRCH